MFFKALKLFPQYLQMETMVKVKEKILIIDYRKYTVVRVWWWFKELKHLVGEIVPHPKGNTTFFGGTD